MTIFDLNKLTPAHYRIIGILCAVLICLFDLWLPLGIADGMLYVALVLLGLLARNRRLVLQAAILGSVLNVFGIFLSPPGGDMVQVLANRMLALLTIWITAQICFLKLRSDEALQEAFDTLEQSVEKRTEELKLANIQVHRRSESSELIKSVAVAANKNESIQDTIQYCLKIICKYTNWPIGHFYLTEYGPFPRMVPTAYWYLDKAEKFDRFCRLSESTSFEAGAGLPGRVLLSKQPEWIVDINEDSNFPRAALAKELGIKAGFAFPVQVGEDVAGVMEFFSLKQISQDGEILNVMAQIGTQLGRIMERQRAQSEITESREQLRSMFNRLEKIREEERTRIARDIHDELAQALTAWKLDLAWLERRIPVQGELKSKISDMYDNLDNTINEVRRMSSELRPQILDIMGICEALRWVTDEFQKRTRINCELHLSWNHLDLDPDFSTTIFRIYQEALTNIARHSGAQKMDARFYMDEDVYVLEVFDNGRGIETTALNKMRALGILGIRERVLQWKGSFDIKSNLGEGTRILVRIPKPEKPGLGSEDL